MVIDTSALLAVALGKPSSVLATGNNFLATDLSVHRP
jgi:hypothetical protein